MSEISRNRELEGAGEPDPGTLTRLLAAAREGDATARERVFTMVLDELRSVARRRLAGEPRPRMDSTELVTEVYAKLASNDRLGFRNSGDLFGMFALEMRSVLVDAARARRARQRREQDSQETASMSQDREASKRLLDADEVDVLLKRFERVNPRAAAVVQHRFFAGLPTWLVAEILEIDERTVRRDWAEAREWLRRHAEMR